MDGIEILKKKAEDLGISLNESQIQQFEKYFEMMVEKNKVMNLTSITEPLEVIDKHFVDSLELGCYLNLTNKKSLIDVGTGAGFPGIPLKIAFPELEITLMDSLNKRILFLRDVISELGLEGISAVHARAEELARNPEYREQFDICTSRAVANLRTLSEYCLPFVKIGGVFAPYKSGAADEEAQEAKNAISKLGGHISKINHYEIPGTDYARSIIVIDKKKMTGKAYPRKAGTPSKNPL